jgi:hypothetical protein
MLEHMIADKTGPIGPSPGATLTRSMRAIRLSPDGFSSPVARIRARGGWAGRSEVSDLRRPRPAPLAAGS